MPLIGLARQPAGFALHWQSIAMAGLADISGVHLTSLNGLLQFEIPTMALVQSTIARPITPMPRPPQQDQRLPGLPGDNARVWAELGNRPLVGIYQTHSHEAFFPALPAGTTAAYSTVWSTTIVQVGWWLAQDLRSHGVGVVQSRVDNMSEGLLASYSRSYYTAKQLLRWYPDVHLLIDLHRAPDTVPAVTVHGVQMAPIMIVVGTNKLLPNPYWHQNLEVALHLAKALKAVAGGILLGKGIDMVPYRYNQQLMPGDLMIEVGGPNSTLAEERYAVHELALAVAQCVRDGAVPSIPRTGGG